MCKPNLMYKKFKIFFSISREDKILLINAWLLTGIIRLIILLVPFKNYKGFMGKHREETPSEIDSSEYKEIKRVAWAISVVSRYTPWESKCLVQAITAQRLLKKRNIPSTLYLGVNKDEKNNMKAHAWLRCGQAIVTGGQNKGEFKEVARFGMLTADK